MCAIKISKNYYKHMIIMALILSKFLGDSCINSVEIILLHAILISIR